MASTQYKYYLRDPFEKDESVIAGYRKAGKKPVMVANKKKHTTEAKFYASGEDKVIPVNIPLADKEVIGQALLIENNVLYRISTDKTKSIITNQK